MHIGNLGTATCLCSTHSTSYQQLAKENLTRWKHALYQQHVQEHQRLEEQPANGQVYKKST